MVTLHETQNEMTLTLTGNNSRQDNDDLDMGLATPVRGFLIIINIILAILGNFFIILTYCRNFKMRTTTNTLVVSLCISDLLSAIADAPFWIAILARDLVYSNFVVCRVLISFQDLFVVAALLNMCGIALDRFITLVKGLRRKMTRKRARMIVMWSWLQAILSALPWCLVSSTCKGRCYSFFPHIYEPEITPRIINIMFKSSNLVLPISIIYYVFIRIVNSVRSSRKVNLDNSYISRNSSAERFAVDAYKRSSKTAIILFTMFLLCTLSYLTVVIYSVFTGNQLINFSAGFAIYFIFSLKRSLFPAIYIFRNRMIVSYLQETLRCGICLEISSSNPRNSFTYTQNNHSSCFAAFCRSSCRTRVHPAVYDGEHRQFPKHLDMYFMGSIRDTKSIIEDQFVNIVVIERRENEFEVRNEATNNDVMVP
ncbi:G-protein coupled receptor 176-like [Stylophora pistillata]|uniref:G-protein coupled receptor 176-like n=1 Tax=Stylophora pistillata TaxID=50429 RepID=UPI000C0397D4|nr:G-protein coupled receptor 176-like [Stylophora pistillata]